MMTASARSRFASLSMAASHMMLMQRRAGRWWARPGRWSIAALLPTAWARDGSGGKCMRLWMFSGGKVRRARSLSEMIRVRRTAWVRD